MTLQKQNPWKYLTVGLLGVIAIGLIAPVDAKPGNDGNGTILELLLDPIFGLEALSNDIAVVQASIDGLDTDVNGVASQSSVDAIDTELDSKASQLSVEGITPLSKVESVRWEGYHDYRVFSNDDFIVEACGSNDNTALEDVLYVRKNPGGPINLVLPLGYIDKSLECMTVGGNNGDQILVRTTQNDGVSYGVITIRTTEDATITIQQIF